MPGFVRRRFLDGANKNFVNIRTAHSSIPDDARIGYMTEVWSYDEASESFLICMETGMISSMMGGDSHMH